MLTQERREIIGEEKGLNWVCVLIMRRQGWEVGVQV